MAAPHHQFPAYLPTNREGSPRGPNSHRSPAVRLRDDTTVLRGTSKPTKAVWPNIQPSMLALILVAKQTRRRDPDRRPGKGLGPSPPGAVLGWGMPITPNGYYQDVKRWPLDLPALRPEGCRQRWGFR